MSLLVESIKIFNGRIYNLPSHQARFDRSRMECFGSSAPVSLREKIKQQEVPSKGLFKCRVIYGHQIESITFQPYRYPAITKLKIITDNQITYPWKLFERPVLDLLFSKKEGAQEIIIVKNGRVTDAYYYNLVFEKNGKFFTPKSPLLEGSRRACLLKNGKIHPSEIKLENIASYEKIHLINAMTGLNKLMVKTSDVIY